MKKLLAEKGESKRVSILNNLQATLLSVLDKGNIAHSITHKLMLEFVQNASESQMETFIGTFKEQLVEILHTKDGHLVAIKCLSLAGAKDRKVILKSFKQFLDKIYIQEYGHLVIIAALMMIDDTVLLNKVILQASSMLPY